MESQRHRYPDLGWVLYDADCAFCTRLAQRLEKALAKRGLWISPLGDPRTRRKVGLGPEDPLDEFKVLLRDGRVIGGADAAIWIAGQIAWTRPLAWLARRGPLRLLAEKAYKMVAAARDCEGRACAVAQRRVSSGTNPLSPRESPRVPSTTPAERPDRRAPRDRRSRGVVPPRAVDRRERG
jgi:predicted DCC family thiol-disulfide oxidoreductase YuxK